MLFQFETEFEVAEGLHQRHHTEAVFLGCLQQPGNVFSAVVVQSREVAKGPAIGEHVLVFNEQAGRSEFPK